MSKEKFEPTKGSDVDPLRQLRPLVLPSSKLMGCARFEVGEHFRRGNILGGRPIASLSADFDKYMASRIEKDVPEIRGLNEWDLYLDVSGGTFRERAKKFPYTKLADLLGGNEKMRLKCAHVHQMIGKYESGLVFVDPPKRPKQSVDELLMLGWGCSAAGWSISVGPFVRLLRGMPAPEQPFRIFTAE